MTKNADEYFNEKICTEYQLKHSYHMLNEQIAFYRWEHDIRKSYIKNYRQKEKHLLSRVIIDMTFSTIMTAWFIYLLHFFAAVGMGLLGVILELIYIIIGIIPAMSYGLSTLLEYLTTKEFSYAVRISRFLGRELPGNELKDLHIELAELERKIMSLEEFSESLYNQVEHLLKKDNSFFMDKNTPFTSPVDDDYKANFLRLSMDIDNAKEQRKPLIKERDDLLKYHKIQKEKAITYLVITILAYILYFTVYYSLSGLITAFIAIGGFAFILFPLIISTTQSLFKCIIKEEFNRAMDIQAQIEALELEEHNLRIAREKLEQ